MEKDKVLLMFVDSWADEMDIQGFEIISLQQFKDFSKKLKNIS